MNSQKRHTACLPTDRPNDRTTERPTELSVCLLLVRFHKSTGTTKLEMAKSEKMDRNCGSYWFDMVSLSSEFLKLFSKQIPEQKPNHWNRLGKNRTGSSGRRIYSHVNIIQADRSPPACGCLLKQVELCCNLNIYYGYNVW